MKSESHRVVLEFRLGPEGKHTETVILCPATARRIGKELIELGECDSGQKLVFRRNGLDEISVYPIHSGAPKDAVAVLTKCANTHPDAETRQDAARVLKEYGFAGMLDNPDEFTDMEGP